MSVHRKSGSIEGLSSARCGSRFTAFLYPQAASWATGRPPVLPIHRVLVNNAYTTTDPNNASHFYVRPPKDAGRVACPWLANWRELCESHDENTCQLASHATHTTDICSSVKSLVAPEFAPVTELSLPPKIPAPFFLWDNSGGLGAPIPPLQGLDLDHIQ